MSKALNNLRKGGNSKISGALASVDESCENLQEEEKTYLRSYTLKESQLRKLQERKIKEINLTLSEIVGKAIDFYCDNN